MFLLRRRLRALTWIAIVAMLGLALLPGVSHALAWAGSGDSAAWAQVCTADGLARETADDPLAVPRGLPEAAAMQHCPYCTPGTPAAALPPSSLQAWLAPDAARAAPVALHLSRVLSAPWSAAQPRAPPARS